jgi:hypothetical protein
MHHEFDFAAVNHEFERTMSNVESEPREAAFRRKQHPRIVRQILCETASGYYKINR